MIFSLTQGTQNEVFEVPIDANGNAVIDPNSEIGKLFFAAAVLQVDLCHYYYALKQYRKTSTRLSKDVIRTDTKFVWWADAMEEVVAWIRLVTSDVRRKAVHALNRQKRNQTLFTDASDVGFGMIFVVGETVFCAGESWSESDFTPWKYKHGPWIPDINQRECFSVEAAHVWLQQLGYDPADTDLRIDNMTARAANRRVWHPNYWINESLKRTHQADGNVWRWKSTEYVQSKLNFSDHPSRYPHLYANVKK